MFVMNCFQKFIILRISVQVIKRYLFHIIKFFLVQDITSLSLHLLFVDVAGLQCQHYIQALQSEANQALNEYVKMIHRGDSARFAKLFLALSMLRSINANVVAGLFFKPVIGAVNMEELLLEMFYGK